MALDKIILDQLKLKCEEFGQSKDFYELLSKWIIDSSEEPLDQAEMIKRLEVIMGTMDKEKS